MQSHDTIETERLILRRWNESDLRDFHEYESQPFVALRTGHQPHGDVNESRQRLDRRIPDDARWAIQIKDVDKVIGGIDLEIRDKNREDRVRREREIVFALNEKYHGQGYATEAINAMLAYGFDVLQLFIIRVNHCDANEQSRRVIMKCGFRFDGVTRFRDVWKYDEKLHHFLNYSLTVDEWKERT